MVLSNPHMIRFALLLSCAVLVAGCLGPASPGAVGSPAVAVVPDTLGSHGAVSTPSASMIRPSFSPAVSAAPLEPALAVGVWVSTVTDRLTLRDTPGLSGISVGLLPVGSTATVVAGPEEMDGYTWYAIAWPGLTWGSGCPPPSGTDSVLACWSHGWVAGAAWDGTPWLVRTEPTCPSDAPDIKALAYLQSGARVACYGSDELVLRAYLSPETQGRGCLVPFTNEPAWLHMCRVSFLQAQATRLEGTSEELAVNTSPDLGVCDFGGRAPSDCPFAPLIGKWIQVTGHFDDPASPGCVERMPDGSEPSHAILAVQGCRERFVVTAVAPTDAP